MIRLAVLGALGYFGYKYLQGQIDRPLPTGGELPSDAIAGGPLSDKATVQHTPELPS